MSIISYAQNLEDVMLWKALKDVANGFYIDVGANDPLIDSVTNVFYQNGWHGINIEPINTHFERLVLARPEDINLNCAISDSKGRLDIWECEVRGWATLNRNVADTHEKKGYKGQWFSIEVKTLAEICAEYNPEDIHFLKVDVEGLELSVLKGNDWEKYRPWIVVVEATIPDTQIENYFDIEEFLIEKNYIFAYTDGLNRFYVSGEHEELLPSMKYPPNIFDNYQTYAEFSALQNIKITVDENNSLSQDILNLRKENSGLVELVQHLEYENFLTQKHIDEILNSTSWRITEPLRLIGKIKKRSAEMSAFKSSKLTKKIIKKLIKVVHDHPRLKYQIVKIIKRIGLYSFIRKLYLNVILSNAPKITFYNKQMSKNGKNILSLSSGDGLLSVDELHNRIKNELEVAKKSEVMSSELL
ncbi:FkbM family methyltransferase [Citrobacter sp. RHBSTW-00271]|uniref:FkbM family methyltransferase n=1 Tax=Citrobacter sp. RHBSTW-00271 TaxID=2742642 RepID=UPI0015FDA499|nr:FkbM family methyltransferase [Citrobacter sp. RHBSTW-00271]MBA7944165.1 FkbM family methyltransferase [Citrobacter sp. RHBSTW-00271]